MELSPTTTKLPANLGTASGTPILLPPSIPADIKWLQWWSSCELGKISRYYEDIGS